MGWIINWRAEEGVKDRLKRSHGKSQERVGNQDANNVVGEYTTKWERVRVVWSHFLSGLWGHRRHFDYRGLCILVMNLHIALTRPLPSQFAVERDNLSTDVDPIVFLPAEGFVGLYVSAISFVPRKSILTSSMPSHTEIDATTRITALMMLGGEYGYFSSHLMPPNNFGYSFAGSLVKPPSIGPMMIPIFAVIGRIKNALDWNLLSVSFLPHTLHIGR